MSSFDAQCLALDARLKTLPDKPEETARATLAALWHLAAGTALSVQAAQERVLPMLDSAGESRLQQFIARRLSGEPLAYITGRQRFLGHEMLADRAALIPRQETELLAGTAIAAGRALLPLRPKPLVMDVCTGSGNVALALAVALPSATVCAADLSAEAVDLARRNACPARACVRLCTGCTCTCTLFDVHIAKLRAGHQACSAEQCASFASVKIHGG